MPNFHDRLNLLFEEAKDKNHKLTQEGFAKVIGARPRQTVSWLAYASYPRVPTLLKIAEKAGVSVSWLLGETSIRTAADRMQSAEWSEIADHAAGLSPQARNLLKEFIDYLKALEKQKIPQEKEP